MRTSLRSLRLHRSAIVAPAVVLLIALAAADKPPATRAEETPEQKARRMAWFNEARFGMFIHWGIYSVPAGEWKGNKGHGEWIMLSGNIPSPEYEKFAAQFNPVQFNAREWVRIAKDAGMKYIVITAKHHDGFSMYDSALTDYDIVDATPYKRDPMKDLAEACREAGLKFCFYYSIADWHHPDMPPQYCQNKFHGAPNPNADLEKYVEYMKGQVRELLTNYGPIGIMWFDSGGAFSGYEMAELIHAQEIIEEIHKLQPNCIVNNRLGLPADYGTPEQHIPGTKPRDPFEVCMTLNNHWGYNKADNAWKEAPQIIRNLVDIASKGGNYLLNVGPTAEGLIPPDSVRILADVGRWMKVNGETIYGTQASPFDYIPEWGRCTSREGKLYLHVFNWPRRGLLRIERLKNEVQGAYLLADPTAGRLKVSRVGEDLLVRLPGAPVDPIETIVVLEIAGAPQVIPFATEQADDGTLTVQARRAIIHGSKAMYEESQERGLDNIGYWVDPSDWVSWFIKMDRPGLYDVDITYACPKGNGGSEYVIEIDGQKLSGTVEATGDGWSDFKTFRVGTLTVEKAGRQELAVRPVRMPGYAVMNLRSVVLTPR
ncbi:MAG: alpha-L-fucosidase [Armatimonadota bacterium]